MNVLVVFVITMALLLLALIKFKWNPGACLFGAALLMGMLSGMPSGDVIGGATKGFGNTLASVGLIVLFGGALGDMLGASGGTEELAKALLRKCGKKYDTLALTLAGCLVSIPVYFAAAYIMMSPLVNSLNRQTGKKRATYACALTVGLILTASIVAPTPGPVAVASELNADLGWFIFYGLVICIPAALIAGWQFSNYIERSRRTEPEDNDTVQMADVIDNQELLKADPTKASALKTVLLILLPIVLILLRSISPYLFSQESVIYAVLNFLGNNVFALFLAMLVAAVTLHKYIVPEKSKSISKLISKSANSFGNILMILGTGGAFASIIKSCGLGDELVELLTRLNFPTLLAAFVLSLILHAAVGSGTVAMTTAVAIFGSVAVSQGFSPVVVGLAICCGGAGLTLPTDGAFWHPSQLNRISVKQTFTTVTASTTLASVCAFMMVVLLNLCSGFLPGL